MADIRINALATTATASASDDYLAIDGAANGTRKLSAYSPTFGGNVGVNGTLSLTNQNFAFWDTGDRTTYGYLEIGHFSNGTFIGTVAGSNTASDVLRLGTGGATRLTISTAGNTTLAGNLTVSGGKASLTSAGNQTLEVISSSGAAQAIAYFSGSGGGSGIIAHNSSQSLRIGRASDSALTGYTDELFIAASSGNLLLGTTTDSSNGKLQLATHTTSAGGIGFGTDTSLYRTQAGRLGIDHLGGSLPALELYESGVLKGQVYTSGGSMNIRAKTGGSLTLYTNDTTALTLDSSQNATFAGRLRVNGNAAVPSGTQQTYIGADATNGAQIIGQGSTNDISLYNSAGNIALRIPTGTQNVTVNGSLAIGNTVTTAVSVASTHKVTISIGGVTYYLLASNV